MSPSPTTVPATAPARKTTFLDPPCKLFTITQFQCSPDGGRLTCWPLKRVFRQCGENKPAIEVTNRLLPSPGDKDLAKESMMVDPAFIKNMPTVKSWTDFKGA